MANKRTKARPKEYITRDRLNLLGDGIRRELDQARRDGYAKSIAVLARCVRNCDSAPHKQIQLYKNGHRDQLMRLTEKAVAHKVLESEAANLGLTLFDVQNTPRAILVLKKMYTKEGVNTMVTRGWAKGSVERRGSSLVNGEAYGGLRGHGMLQPTQTEYQSGSERRRWRASVRGWSAKAERVAQEREPEQVRDIAQKARTVTNCC